MFNHGGDSCDGGDTTAAVNPKGISSWQTNFPCFGIPCSDLALALCLDAQQIARPDLRIAVMSATLGGGLADRVVSLMQSASDLAAGDGDAEPLNAQPRAPVIVSEGRSYPVGESQEREKLTVQW